jgi:uncharacterized protein
VNISSDYVLASLPPGRVFEALLDPAVLRKTIPGCRRLEPLDDSKLSFEVRIGVGAVAGVYDGEIAFFERVAPTRAAFEVTTKGRQGSVRAIVRNELAAAGEGTRVSYTAEAHVSGALAGVGQRVLGGVVKRTTQEFFRGLERELTSPAQAPNATSKTRRARSERGRAVRSWLSRLLNHVRRSA